MLRKEWTIRTDKRGRWFVYRTRLIDGEPKESLVGVTRSFDRAIFVVLIYQRR